MSAELRAMRNEFLALYAKASGGRHFEIAYHALAAALHCANDLKDRDSVSRIAAFAVEGQNAIEAAAPNHPLSSENSGKHGNESIFRLLRKQAKSMLRRLTLDDEAEKQRDRTNPKG